MEKLLPYEIPEHIQKIEFEDNDAELKKLGRKRHTPESYTDLFSSMIYLEEAANSKELKKYDLTAKVKLCSRIDKTLSVEIKVNIFHIIEKTNFGSYNPILYNLIFMFKLQKSMHKYTKTLENSILGAFTMKSCSENHINFISGRIKGCDKNSLVLTIMEGFSDALEMIEDPFEIKFTINRSIFQMQHRALKWLNDHCLFAHLIQNPRFLKLSRSESILRRKSILFR